MSDEQNASAPPAPQETVGQLAQQASSIAGAGESLACQWQGCGERCTSAENLYVVLSKFTQSHEAFHLTHV